MSDLREPHERPDTCSAAELADILDRFIALPSTEAIFKAAAKKLRALSAGPAQEMTDERIDIEFHNYGVATIEARRKVARAIIAANREAMTTDKASEREAFVYWWRHKYSAADLEGIPEHVALNAAWAAWQARAALPQQAQDIAEASGGAEGGPEEDRIEAAFWRFDARHKGYGQWRQAPMSERDAFKAEMRNALHAEAVRAEMRMVVKGWRKQGPQQAQETSLPDCGEAGHAEGRCGNAQCLRGASLPPQGAERNYSDMSREALERHAKRLWQTMETAHAFWHKHALGPLAAPSCLCCGKLPDEVAIRHMELPGVVICKTCRDTALAASPAPAPQEPAAEPDHELKTWPPFFEEVLSGRKTFEVRKNDRGFAVGHVVRLNEWAPDKGYTGRFVDKRITYMLTGPQFGIEAGYSVLALYASPAPGELGAVDAAAGASQGDSQ